MFNQIVHSEFMKALVELALFLEIDSFQKSSTNISGKQNDNKQSYSWFENLSVAIHATDALFRSQPFPCAFVEERDADDSAGLVCRVALFWYLWTFSVYNNNNSNELY